MSFAIKTRLKEFLRRTTFRNRLAQPVGYVTLVLYILVVFSQLFPAFTSAQNYQLSSRSITLGSSAVSTATTYKVQFTTTQAATELIIDFCSNDPLPGDNCNFASNTTPTVASGTTTVASVSGGATGTISFPGTGTPKHTIDVTGLTIPATSTYTITFAGVTNPSATTPAGFYARILTYGTGNSSGYAPANTTGGTTTTGTYLDYGGIALAITTNVNIQAKVFETLEFCVFLSGPSAACGSAPTFTLGSSVTGALSTTTAYIASGSTTSADGAEFSIATNAGGGIQIAMSGTTLCRNATPANCVTATYPSNVISAIGPSPAASNPANSQFGMCVDDQGITGTGVAVPTTYDDTVGNCHSLTVGTDNAWSGTNLFGFNDSSTSSGGTNYTGGSQILTSTGAINQSDGFMSFIANISATTTAGVYNTSLNLVATGTF